MIRTVFITLATLILLSPLVAADDWGATDTWDTGGTLSGLDLSGYLETTGLTVLPRKPGGGNPETGLQTVLRLRGRFEPEPFLSVTVETEFLDRRGVVSLPGDESRQIYFDYLYGAVAFGPVDVRAGRQPLAWGTAYALNPTDLMNPTGVEGLAGIEPPGITALSSSVTLGERLGLEGYLGFEDRNRRAVPGELSRVENLPWGIRGRAFVGLWDFGIGLARATESRPPSQGNDTVHTEEYAVAEFAGSIGPVLLYGEAAVEIGTAGRNPDRALDGAVGVQWDPTDTLSLQAEYHRRGDGALDPDDYPTTDRLARRLVGRDYLVAIGGLSFLDDDLQLTVAPVINLNDWSSAVMPEMTFRVTDDFQTGLGGSFSLGSRRSEFDGRITDEENGEIDLGRPRVFAQATWYF